MKNYSINYTERLENTLKENNLKLVDYTEYNNPQFKSCQAWCVLGDVMDLTTGELYENVQVLQSYNTLVACIVNGVLYRGKWSTTTSKQITQWANGKYFHSVVMF